MQAGPERTPKWPRAQDAPGASLRGLMRNKHYLTMALMVMAGIWLYAIGQSLGHLRALFDAVPVELGTARTEPTVENIESASQSTSARADEVPRRDAREPATADPAEAVPQPAPVPYRNEADRGPLDRAPRFSIDQTDLPADVVHPEVTDPRMRRLLQPAWDD